MSRIISKCLYCKKEFENSPPPNYQQFCTVGCASDSIFKSETNLRLTKPYCNNALPHHEAIAQNIQLIAGPKADSESDYPNVVISGGNTNSIPEDLESKVLEKCVYELNGLTDNKAASRIVEYLYNRYKN